MSYFVISKFFGIIRLHFMKGSTMRQMGLAVLTALAVVSLAPVYAAWPRYLGPQGTGFADDVGINKDWNNKAPKKLWTLPLSDNGYGGPIVADKKVFIMDHTGGGGGQDVVRALDLETGKQAWEFAFVSKGSKDNYGFTRPSPCYAEGMLYIAGKMGEIACLDANTGKGVWEKHLVTNFGGNPPKWEFSASPVVDEDRLLIQPGGKTSLVVLNRKDGTVIWQGPASNGSAGYAAPVKAKIGGVDQYVVMTDAECWGLDHKTGAKLWSFEWKTNFGVNACVPIVIDDQILVSSGYNMGTGLYKITDNKAQQLWFTNAAKSRFSTPIYHDGFVYSTGDQDTLACLDIKTGKPVWTVKGFQWGGLLAADGTLIVMDAKKGALVQFALDGTVAKELGRMEKPVGGKNNFWTAPVLSEGRLILRSPVELAVYDLK